MSLQRLSKVIAAAGLASRRGAERLVSEGSVTVGGELITNPAHKVDPSDVHIKVNGKLLPKAKDKVYVLVNKPRGMISTAEAQPGRRTLSQLLEPLKTPVRPVDRLDANAEGLVLCTNDGDVAFALSRPKGGIPRTYLVKVKGVPNERVLAKLASGVPLPDGRSLPIKVRVVNEAPNNTWLQLVTRESRSHIVERVFLKLKHPVRKVKRTAFAGLTGRGMPLGSFRWLNPPEIKALKALAADPPGLVDLEETGPESGKNK